MCFGSGIAGRVELSCLEWLIRAMRRESTAVYWHGFAARRADTDQPSPGGNVTSDFGSVRFGKARHRASRCRSRRGDRGAVLAALGGLALVAWLGVWHAVPAHAAEACPALVASQPLPAEAQPEFVDEPNWRARVAQLDHELANADLARVRLLFLGDSITEGWMPLLFQQFYGQRAALNLGVRGDSTQGMLWRLAHGPLGQTLRPRLVVLLIGTNDLWPGARPENIALGIAQVARTIRQRSPDSRILLVGILPRGGEPTDPLRQMQAKVNELIAHCADGAHVMYADPGRMLVDGEGRLSDQVAFDYLHLTWIGYGILSAALEPYIRQALGD
jgi:beta-glucosidase